MTHDRGQKSRHVAGICACGCGEPTSIAKQSRKDRGQVIGEPVRFVPGHNQRAVKGRPGIQPSPLTALWTSWLRRRRRAAPATIDAYDRALWRLERHAGVGREHLSVTDLEDYLLSTELSARTKEQTFHAVRSWHRWGAARGYWPLSMDIEEMRVKKGRTGPQPALGAADASSMLSAATTQAEIRLAYLGLFAGLRLSSILDVDHEGWQGNVIAVRVKGNWIHRLPAHPILMERRDEILAESSTRKELQTACRKLQVFAGGAPVTSRWLRRTFGYRMVELGVERPVIGALLGHSPSSVTEMHYAPVTWTEMTQAIQKFHYGRDSEVVAG